jgi:hypothetical protein
MPTIYVSRNGQNGTTLRLRDSEGHNPNNDNLTTDVNASDTVTWEKDPWAEPGADHQAGYFPIDQLTSVTGKVEEPGPPKKYPGSINIFATGPTVTSNVGTATILATKPNPNPGGSNFENYSIGYTLPGDSTPRSDDPKLIMR